MTVQRAEEHNGAVVPLRGGQGEVLPSTVLRQFAADGVAAMQMALQIAPTPFVPESYKKQSKDQWYTAERIAQNVAAAWLAGDEIGLRPMQSLQAIDIIEGRPALNARSMRALVQAAGHEVWVEEQPGEDAPTQQLSVTVAGRRRNTEHVERVTWTWKRAQRAQLVGRKNWEKSPVDMLIARATSAVCRLIASDVLMGLGYSVEELQDEEEGGPTTPATTTVRRGSTVNRAQPAEDPFEEPSSPAGDKPEDEGSDALGAARAAAEEADQGPRVAPTTRACSFGKPDGSGAVCDRPQGHEGRHHYAMPEGTAQPREEEPEEGAGERTEIPEQPAGNPLREDEEDLFGQPSDAELEAALEADRAERAEREAQERAEREAAQAAAGVPQGMTAAETARQRPAAVEDDPTPEPEDDPWADFQ